MMRSVGLKFPSSVKEFAQETPIQGIKELFVQDAETGLKIFWGLFLLVCMGLMLKQTTLACIDYRDEKTVTLVRVDDVSDNFTGSLNICFKVSAMDLVNQNSDLGRHVGRLLVGGSLLYRKPSMWTTHYNTDSIHFTTGGQDNTVPIDLVQFAVTTRQNNVTHATEVSFNKGMKQMLEAMDVTELFTEDVSYMPSGIDDDSLCFVSRYQTFVTSDVSLSDVEITINSNSTQHVAVSFYSFRDNVFDLAKGVNLFLMSSKMRRTSKRDADRWGIEDEVSSADEQSTSQPPFSNYHTDVFMELSAKKFIMQNLRRRPCHELPADVMLPAGRSKDICVVSCMLQTIRSIYNCSFENHFDVNNVDAYEGFPLCHWFDMIDQFRTRLAKNCTAGLFRSIDYYYFPDYLSDDSNDYVDAINNSSYTSSVCDMQQTMSEWGKIIIYLMKEEIKDKSSHCYSSCATYRSCTEWQIDHSHEKKSYFRHNDSTEELTVFISKPNIVTVFEESLAVTVEDFVGNIGGIVGFYFGFSLVSLMHILFFVAYRWLRKSQERRRDVKPTTTPMKPSGFTDQFGVV